MPNTFMWIAADRCGRLARFAADHFGVIPRMAPILETAGGDAVWHSIHAIWVKHVALVDVFAHHDLQMVPESASPHLVAFARTLPKLPGGEGVGDRVLSFARIPDELRALLVADEDAEDPAVIGSMAIDESSFSAHWTDSLFDYDRWENEPRYKRRESAPHFPIVRPMLGNPDVIPVLDLDFAESPFVDVAALLPPDDIYELGR